jgi:alpha-L-fucosidase 2
MTDFELWYERPAAVWTEALPIGNGRLGAMVFGDISRERLQINESTFYTGGPYQPINPDARGHLEEVRALIFAGKYAEAEALSHRTMMAKPYLQTSFQPVGDVWLAFHHQMGATGYRRALDLDSAVASSTYAASGINYRREAFASPVGGIIAYRVLGGTGTVSIDVGLSSPQIGEMEPSTANGLMFRGRNRREQGIAGALKFVLAARVINLGGELTNSPETLRVRGADEVLILVDAATSFRRYDDVSGDPEALVNARLDAAASLSYDALLKAHQDEHRRLFRGMSVDLGRGPGAELPTDRRVINYASGDDPGLGALFLQYGRYLMISSSRPGTQPANLQGLWNEELRPSWGSKYTCNINLEMNYWLPDPANLADCFEPLIELVEDVARNGAAMAKAHYGARGWVLHHNTDLWRATGPVDGPQWGLWPMGGAWLTAQLWDHWQFSRDPTLLKRLYPLMKGAAEFLLDYLVSQPGTGFLVTNPSLSPENQHPFGSSLCAGPAMDNQIIRDLFGGLIEASASLGVDADLRERLVGALGRIRPDQIGYAGQLQEWADDWDLDAPEPHHRHISHLYALYPSWQIQPEATPALAAAARRTLEQRGDDATGWGIGWRLNLWARLHDGGRADAVLTRLLSPDRTYPNLFDAHPPFQIDGNFGGAAGIIEMLVQSSPSAIAVLPALPHRWPTGRIDGVRCRGGVEVGVSWRDGGLVEARFTSVRGAKVVAAYGEQRLSIVIPSGGSVTVRSVGAKLAVGNDRAARRRKNGQFYRVENHS